MFQPEADAGAVLNRSGDFAVEAGNRSLTVRLGYGHRAFAVTYRCGAHAARAYRRSRKTMLEGVPTGVYRPVKERRPVARSMRNVAMASPRWLQE